jgi:glycosyltransferase involved in cell wall biosynthesis
VKIAFLHFWTLRLPRGVETLTLSLANALAAQEHAVAILCAKRTREPLVKPAANVRVREFPTFRYVVIPSREEPFGMVALEAMALGKPIVATRAGGLPELLQDADAILVETNDAAALAQGIQAMLGRIAQEPQYGARNRERAARFGTDPMVKGYLELFV